MNAHSPIVRPQPDSPTTAGMVALARQVTGFLDGAEGPPLPGWHVPGADNSALLQDLHAALARTYPEAGQPLWAVRIWTNLIWQPAYLAAIAVHRGAMLPDLSRISQRRDDIHISGYRIEGAPLTGLSTEAMIAKAGAQLRALADTMLAEVNAVTKLKRIPALRLLTDRMLGLMTSLQQTRPDLSTDAIRAYCRQWLAAMDLTGQGDLESIHLKDGREVLIIARKGCCLDYLIDPGVYCASCPKQPDTLRRAHQRADAEAAFR